MKSSQADGRLFSLDVLRGLAAFMVLWRHVPIKARPDLSWTEYLVKVMGLIGWCGVDLFFVLSGFLISSLLFREVNRTGTLDVRRFWIRRGMKIWPAYYCAYGLWVVVCSIHGCYNGEIAQVKKLLVNAAPNAVFVQNYCDPGVRWDNSWSIAVEEHFYLILPLLLLLLAQLGRRQGEGSSPREWFRQLVVMSVLLGTILLLARGWKAIQGEGWVQIYYPSHLRADSLFCGVLLGYLCQYQQGAVRWLVRRWPVLVLAIPAALAVPMFWRLESSAFTLTFGFTLLYLAFGGLVLVAAVHPDLGKTGPPVVSWLPRIFAWLGAYSYTVYLAHSIVYGLPGIPQLRDWAAALVSDHAPLLYIWLDRLLFFGLSIAGGVLLAYTVERPFLRLRDRFYPSSAKIQLPPRRVITDGLVGNQAA